jgi:glycerophosphoryl diester phosphodiesterase
VLLVAHRTPAAADRCARLAAAGAQVFEIDVQLVGGRLAVSHYLPLGRAGRVQRDNWRVRWHTASARDPGVLDVAAAVPPECTVLLDIKEKLPHRRRDLLAAMAETLPDRDRFRICGPWPDDLEAAREAGFRTWRTVGRAADLRAVLAGGELPDAAVSIRHSLINGESLEQLHARVPIVVVWTVNELARARRLRELGVDGVTTDRLAVLRELAGSTRSR